MSRLQPGENESNYAWIFQSQISRQQYMLDAALEQYSIMMKHQMHFIIS